MAPVSFASSTSSCFKPKDVLHVALLLCVCVLLWLPASESLLEHHIRKLHQKLRGQQKLSQQLVSNNSLWMTQTTDHFNPQDPRNFQQRYYENVDFFKDPHGPIFLEICGESECDGIYDDYYMVLAKKVNAAIVTLEHRYYGKSIPTVDLETSNLKYLSTQQALFDLATFRNYYQNLIIRRYNLSTHFENPWIVLGGSYAGALSAWFRLKFPHLVRGSISSSGVVNAIENYQEYDIQIGVSLGPICSDAYQEITRRLEEGLAKNATYIKSLFNATELNDGDFASFVGTLPALLVQYATPEAACTPILEAIKNGSDILEVFINITNSNWGGKTSEFSQETLKQIDPTIDVGRQWTYQQCSEVGLFLTAASKHRIFMKFLNLQYYLELCENVFGKNISPPTDITNLYYGATRIAGSNILFLNGSQDPYRHASKESSSPSETSILISCENCAHCVDINGCSFLQGGDAKDCALPNNLHQARSLMEKSIISWINHK